MATTVYDVEEVELQDGSILKLKPLAISRLKRFMTVMNTAQEATTEDKALEVLIDACTIVIESQHPELAKDREKLEDALDVPTINRIIKICGGIDLEDPNLLAAAVLAGTN